VTGREYIVTKMRRPTLCIAAGLFCFFVGIISRWWWMALPAFAVAFAGTIRWQFGVCCPFCRNMLSPVIYPAMNLWWRLDRRVKFCPYCGRSLEEEVPS
jgi:hypothetical protein